MRLSNIILPIILIISGVSNLEAFAQSRFDTVSYAETQRENLLRPPVIFGNQKLICEVAEDYGVSGASIAYVLFRQVSHLSLADQVQNFAVAWWVFMPSEKEMLNKYKEHQRGDLRRIAENKVNPPRDARDSWLFASVGPAQMQIYTAYFVRDFLSKGRIRFPTMKSVAQALVHPKAAIEFLAAELMWFHLEYQAVLGVDIRDNLELNWLLHNLGSPRQRAMLRRDNPSDFLLLEELKVESRFHEFCSQG